MKQKWKNKEASSIVPIVLGAILAVIIVCGIVVANLFSLLERASGYDPEEEAVLRVTQCLDASIEDRAVYCGYSAEYPCWDAIDRAASESDNQYTIDVLWYNREDEICCRGGNEVYLRVKYANDTVVKFLYYEGTLEACEIGE